MELDHVQCSLCKTDILGRCVGLMDLFDMEIDWTGVGMGTYQALAPNGGGRKDFVLLHENCFSSLLDQLAKQELSTVIALTVGTVADLRDAMGM